MFVLLQESTCILRHLPRGSLDKKRNLQCLSYLLGISRASHFIITCLGTQLEHSLFTLEITKCLTYPVIRGTDGYDRKGT